MALLPRYGEEIREATLENLFIDLKSGQIKNKVQKYSHKFRPKNGAFYILQKKTKELEKKTTKAWKVIHGLATLIPGQEDPFKDIDVDHEEEEKEEEAKEVEKEIEKIEEKTTKMWKFIYGLATLKPGQEDLFKETNKGKGEGEGEEEGQEEKAEEEVEEEEKEIEKTKEKKEDTMEKTPQAKPNALVAKQQTNE